MTNNRGNNSGVNQPFADTISIDCFLNNVSDFENKFKVHAVAVFNSGEFGDDVSSPVTFTMSLRKAELVVIIPKSESSLLDIAKETVARDLPKLQGTRKTKFKKAGWFKLGFKKDVFGFGGGVGAAKSEDTTLTETFDAIQITCSVTEDGHYRWSIESNIGATLKGPSWDILKERFTVIRKNKRGISPFIRIEVRCKRKDLQIENLELKSTAKAKYGDNQNPNKIIAAQAFIRTKLFESGLIDNEGNTDSSRFVIGAELIDIQ
ncbi:MAG: hypothetical protein WBQ60_07925 [Asticcacaulis sp.]